VLDTNVLLHDPTSLFRFEEHDIFLPMIVLEELDGHKKGMTEVARNGRQTSRTLDALAGVQGADIAHGPASSTPPATAKPAASCSSRPSRWTTACPPACPRARPTTRSWAWWRRCASSTHRARWCWCPRTSTCASRRARWACRRGLPERQDAGRRRPAVLRRAGRCPRLLGQATARHGKLATAARTPSTASAARSCRSLLINQFVYFEAPGEPSLYARVTEIRGKTAVLKTLKDFGT
jgi:PhoH-like ATPase